MQHDRRPATGAPRAGWYGKIPAAGDFVHRNVSRDIIAWWDRWLQMGLSGTWAQSDGMRRTYALAPMWNFAIPAGSGPGVVQLGCLAASHDRVGRRYPVCALANIDPDAYGAHWLDGAGGFYRQLGTALSGALRNGHSAEQLDQMVVKAGSALTLAPSRPDASGDDIMSILDPQGSASVGLDRLAWPDLPLCFNPHAHTSYWWTNQADGAALRTYVHGGALNVSLFSTLFVPTAGARRETGG